MEKALLPRLLCKYQMKIISKLFVSLFYVGYFKIWPGTVASLISILIIFPFINFNFFSDKIFIGFFILIFLTSLFFIKKFSFFTKTHDSGIIVIDEFLGIYFIFIFYDFIYFKNSLLTLVLIFLLFRFFDIVKVFPANIIDKKMNNPLGVLLDDIVASIYTIIILYTFNVYS